jgi:hypothetical protein
MEVKLEPIDVGIEPRKLAGNWTVESIGDWFDSSLDNTMPLLEGEDNKFTFGVDSRLLSISRRRDLFDWVEQTFDPVLYKITGEFKAYIWFKQEKHRTLLIIKWS